MLRLVIRILTTRGSGGRARLQRGLAATTLAFRILSKVVGKEPKVVYSEKLEPGQTLVITHLTHHVG